LGPKRSLRDSGASGWNSPILLKNSDLGEARNFACPLNRIAHLRHEGIAAHAENLVQEPRSAFAPASNEIAPLQIQFGENQTQSHKRVFQQYPPKAAVGCLAISVCFAVDSRLAVNTSASD
jgi:hypothetical protein